MIIVDSRGKADYVTVQEAINSIPEDNNEEKIILVRKGVYNEKITITTPHITLVGENPNDTIITYNDYAKKLFADGTPYRTFNTYTMFVGATDTVLRNLTIQNTAGLGQEVGQGVALYVEGDRSKVEGCRIIAHQDTLFTGPLPHKPIEGNDFGGPMQGKERVVGRQYYERCYIEGDIDFIFGSARAVFRKCNIVSNGKGYITAASTYKGQEYGYLFLECNFNRKCEKNSVYLGRPWRDYAKTVLIRCNLGEHIKKEGWNDWNKELARKEAFYAEYNNFGLRADMRNREKWVHALTEEEAEKYTLDNILSGDDHWNYNL